MISALKALFEIDGRDDSEALEHQLRLASAALLIETARADFTQDGVEEAAMHAVLCTGLGLAATEVDELLGLASDQVDAATSLFEFTRVINDHFSPSRKRQLVAGMWAVAYADGNVDKYEEHLIRRVADLLYVPHEDYIRAKLDAAAASQTSSAPA
jgi:uncharacterized tellurite resistance protein B-like protein